MSPRSTRVALFNALSLSLLVVLAFVSSAVAGPISSSQPGVAWRPGTQDVDVAVVGSDGHVWLKRHAGTNLDGWTPWTDLGGDAVGTPLLTSGGSANENLYVRGADGRLKHRYWDGTQWYPWDQLGGTQYQLASEPVVVQMNPNRVDLFARSVDNHTLHLSYDGVWHDWEDLGGWTTTRPTAVTVRDGHMEVFNVKPDDDTVIRRVYNNGVWGAWDLTGLRLRAAGTTQTVTGPIAAQATRTFPNVGVTLLARGTDGSLVRQSEDASGAWQPYWTLAGHGAAGSPALSSPDAPAKSAFLRDTDGSLWLQSTTDGATWSTWSRLSAGALSGDPVAVAWSGHTEVFGVFSDGTLARSWGTGTGLSTDWRSLGAPPLGSEATPAEPGRDDPVAGAPGAAMIPGTGGSVSVAVRGVDDRLYFANHGASGTWAPWSELGGSIAGSPVVTSDGVTNVNVYARGTGNDLQHRFWDGTQWYAWDRLGGTQYQLGGDPIVVRMSASRVDLFARSSTDTLLHLAYNNGWGSWEDLGGSVVRKPAAVSLRDGHLDVAAVAADGHVAHRVYANSAWGAWTTLGVEKATSGLSATRITRAGAAVATFYGRGADRYVMAQDVDGNGVGAGWKTLGTPGAIGAPSAVSSDGTIRTVATRGIDSAVWNQRSTDATSWLGFGQVSPSPTGGDPVLVGWSGHLEAYVHGTDGKLWRASGDGQWLTSPWEQVPNVPVYWASYQYGNLGGTTNSVDTAQEISNVVDAFNASTSAQAGQIIRGLWPSDRDRVEQAIIDRLPDGALLRDITTGRYFNYNQHVVRWLPTQSVIDAVGLTTGDLASARKVTTHILEIQQQGSDIGPYRTSWDCGGTDREITTAAEVQCAADKVNATQDANTALAVLNGIANQRAQVEQRLTDSLIAGDLVGDLTTSILYLYDGGHLRKIPYSSAVAVGIVATPHKWATSAGLGQLPAGADVGPYKTSWDYGGVDHQVDTQGEVDAVAESEDAADEAGRAALWAGLSPADKAYAPGLDPSKRYADVDDGPAPWTYDEPEDADGPVATAASGVSPTLAVAPDTWCVGHVIGIAYGKSNKHRYYAGTTSQTFGFYSVSLSAQTFDCDNGRSRTYFSMWWDTRGLPSGANVKYQWQMWRRSGQNKPYSNSAGASLLSLAGDTMWQCCDTWSGRPHVEMFPMSDGSAGKVDEIRMPIGALGSAINWPHVIHVPMRYVPITQP